MRRRQFLLAGVALLAGCTGTPAADDGDTPPTSPENDGTATPTAGTDTSIPETPTGTTDTPTPGTPTATWSPGGTAEMGPETNMVEVAVAEDFDGEAVLAGSCVPDGEVTLGGGDVITVEREEPGEGCSYGLRVNGSRVESGDVGGYETVMIDVLVDGSVDVSTVVV